MENQRKLLLILTLITVFHQAAGQIVPGAARNDQYYPALGHRNVGIVANHASVIDHQNIVDVLLGDSIRILKIFSPEHGFRLDAEAGEQVGHSRDPLTGIEIISLYGKRKKPGKEDLQGIDVMLFDIQDVGVRFYTYISTLAYIMESCAEQQIPVIVLDRPNPNGFYVDGPVLERKHRSFVGMHPVPIVYGMTIGEYAMMVNGEGWLPNGLKCDLQVVSCGNYNRNDIYELPERPSPNLTSMNAVLLYPSLCLFEGTVISIGRGTPYPFEVFGHPDLASGGFQFIPVSLPGMSLEPPYKGLVCNGTDLRNYFAGHPKDKGKILLDWLMKAYHQMPSDGFFTGYFDQLAGTDQLRKQILSGMPEKKIRASWKPGIEKFKKIRLKYLIY